MKIAKKILTAADTLVNSVVVLALLVAGVYAGYALWDNSLVYAAVDDVQAEMLKLKPEGDRPSFSKLQTINPDVCAWVTLDNTNIDCPVLQGETNLSYVNTDVFGEFALAGSIFLDSRNERSFNEPYSLLYGHSMEKGKMFGDLNLYKDEAFFREHLTGSLLVPERVYQLNVFAYLVVPSSDKMIFEPLRWQGNSVESLLQYADKNALYLNDDALKNIAQSATVEPQILALTTCTAEYTDARTVVLAVMSPDSSAE